MKAIKFFILSLFIVTALSGTFFSLTLAAPVTDESYRQTCPEQTNGHPTTLSECNKWILEQAGGGDRGYGSNTTVDAPFLASKVGSVLGMVLSVFGVVFFGLVVFSGIQWMTAGGNEEKVGKARDRIIRAAIGFGIVMMAWALTKFLVTQLQTNTGSAPKEAQKEAQYECPNICEDGMCEKCVNKSDCGTMPDGVILGQFSCFDQNKACCRYLGDQ